MLIPHYLESPYSIVKRVYLGFKRIFLKKMPLENEFQNYDQYWKSRKTVQHQFRYKYVASLLPDEGSVLDLGCGRGDFLKYLKSIKPNLNLTGVDVSELAINELRKDGIDGIVCDLSSEELPDDLNIDYVVLMEFIEHIPNPEDIIRSLNKHGVKEYFITIPNLGFIEHRLRLALGGKMPLTTIEVHINEHLRFWTVSDFKHWADHLGLRVEKIVGQYGVFNLWKVWPTLFASGLIYVLRKK